MVHEILLNGWRRLMLWNTREIIIRTSHNNTHNNSLTTTTAVADTTILQPPHNKCDPNPLTLILTVIYSTANFWLIGCIWLRCVPIHCLYKKKHFWEKGIHQQTPSQSAKYNHRHHQLHHLHLHHLLVPSPPRNCPNTYAPATNTTTLNTEKLSESLSSPTPEYEYMEKMKDVFFFACASTSNVNCWFVVDHWTFGIVITSEG